MTMSRRIEKPLLIYDGDCGFCRYWIERWHSVTGDSVVYEPFQKVADQFPDIPAERFQKSVQLVTPEGKVYSGAEAVFRTLAFAPGKGKGLSLYQHFPGFAPVSEGCYRVIAANRPAFSFLTRLFFGTSAERPSYFFSRWIFLRFFGVIYLVAFASLGVQLKGLIGAHGILPAQEFLHSVRQSIGLERYLFFPTIFWVNASDAFLQAACGAGILFSLLLIFDIAPAFFLFLLWAGYLSFTTVCQDFFYFQWDALLLEAGFLAIFLAPLHLFPKKSSKSPPSPLILTLLWWLLFRLMFSSGMVKLLSGDPMWRHLTALNYHYETQPIPPWTAWYMHHLPEAFQKFSVLVMFAVELAAPFCIFLPRRMRLAGCAALIFLQFLILATGNYCFFNWLALALCLLLLDDSVWPLRWRKKASSLSPLSTRRWPPGVILCVAAFLFILSTVPLLGLSRMPQPRPVVALYRSLSSFHLVGSYGLFAVMTTQRPEIILEGSDDGIRWLPYEFQYKAGDLKRRPPFVAPHQPRLDWQMWFAALGDARENPWFFNFCIRILQGSPDVLALLEKNPFPDHPPRYLRATRYNYHFTDSQTRKRDGTWWQREEEGVYCPVLSLRKP